ncbi:MAG TPA: hypothetical protein VF634_07350, partial [Pyrinomonadaceae bacterium]
MTLEFDKEIDSLLREGARRGASARLGAASERGEDGGLLRATPPGAHLDADEQNAYAENSLPAPARMYYAAHLADCDDCRRSVTQLALAAGTPAQLERQAAAATGPEVLSNVTWRERLGALLAPRAWRYAVPALALLLVGAVALTVLMRQPQRDVSVAQQRNTSEQAKPASSETHHAPQNNDAAAGTSAGEAASASNSNATATREEIAGGALEEQQQPKTGAILNDANPPPPPPLSAGTATTSAPVTTADIQPTPQPTPEPVPEAAEREQKVKAVERADELAKDARRQGNYENIPPRERISGPSRNNSEQSRNIQRGVIIDGRDSNDKNDRAAATASSAPPAPTAAMRSAKKREADGERGGNTSDDSARSERMPAPKPAAETRTVAGRKFRRSGDAWIDTAYQSSQAVTVVRRNSEQYRALVADEPQLRRIGDAL